MIEHTLIFEIEKTAKMIRQYSQKQSELLDNGLTIDQWNVLLVIKQNENISLKDLSKLVFRDTASITRSIQILEEQELIIKSTDSDDFRKYLLKLSPKAEFLLQVYDPEVSKHRKKCFDGFFDQEMQLLSTFMKRVQENVLERT